uniref:Putative Flp pilus-assembly TadG-like N-terminal domain-containing protein n=1 Tax=Mycolicibacterium gilvum (strain PYR-GCK) TaxID=350054 RepID=A4T5S5_MYCGI|nr:hypothetical protein Mflv_1388 [Mycolicibacterium gilvum PYR-GCK]
MLAAMMCVALLAVTCGAAVLGSAVAARHRAQAAADLAALGAAGRLADGHDAACRIADQIVRAMRTTLGECAVDGLDVVVRVDAGVSLGGPLVGSASASARAGPADGSG